MKKEFFALSMKWGAKAFVGMKDAEAQVLASDCPLAAIQIEQAIGVRPLNPIEILARAYDADGFATPVPPPDPPVAEEGTP
jgi:Fe-S oxidoreductase